jgi:hypothetical protein
MTPEEIKAHYKKNGYSIVAYTDHEVLVPHPELADEDFLALYGYEFQVLQEGKEDIRLRKCCHICFIAIDPDHAKQVCHHRSKYVWGNARNYKDVIQFDENAPDYERVYSHDGVNDVMKRGMENGFFVTYNHPVWSVEEFTDYSKYRGFDAMEICNFSSVAIGFAEYNPMVYDEMLRACGKLYCVATDDNHQAHDCFGGFTVIRADKLDYATIAKALKQGDFYASQGPEIKELWYEDGKVFVETSPVQKIFITKPGKNVGAVQSEDLVTYASFNVDDDDAYFYVTVVDEKGRRAYTNAYFPDEFLKA